MPGFNQNGPMNQGPMTGKGRGLCQPGAAPELRFSRNNVAGYCSGSRMAQGYCRRNRGGMGFQSPFRQAPATTAESRTELQSRADFLKKELSAIKKELAGLSE